MKKSIRPLLALAFGASLAAQAATEFGEAIPTDLAKALLGIGTVPGTGLYMDMPDAFPAFAMPTGFSVLGSIDQRMFKMAYLRSELPAPEAVEALRQAFVDAGWTALDTPDPSSVMSQRGFFNNNMEVVDIPPNAMLCRQNEGNMHITASAYEGYTLVRANHSGVQSNMNCSDMQARYRQQREQGSFRYRDPFIEQIPRLEFPLDGSTGRPPGNTGGFSGGNGEWTTTATIQIDWDLARLYEHFAAQVSAQGWMPEESWLTARTAGGTWTGGPAPDQNHMGMLSIVKKGEGDYSLEFRLATLQSP